MKLRKPIETITSHIITPHWYRPDKPGFPYEPAYEALEFLSAQIHGLRLPTESLMLPYFEGSITLSIEELGDLDIAVIKSNNALAEYWRDSFVIRAKGRWTEPNEILRFCVDTGRIGNRDVVTRVCANFSKSIVNKILVLMNLYLPGSSRCLHYYSRDKLFGIASQACDSSFDDAAVILMEAGLSPMPRISFTSFLDWSLKVDGFWTGIPNENVGRAMTFFSHAHHSVRIVHTFAEISWIIASLEALFTESSQEIRSKIIRRTFLLCPEIKDFISKKEIGQLYDFRPRFLHGDVAIPNQFSDEKQSKWYGHEFSRVFDLSSTILIRSIQRISEKGWTSLKFEEAISEQF